MIANELGAFASQLEFRARRSLRGFIRGKESNRENAPLPETLSPDYDRDVEYAYPKAWPE